MIQKWFPALLFSLIFFCLSTSKLLAQTSIFQTTSGVVILDTMHYSTAFAGQRNYRIFLPKNYKSKPETYYPTIYYFHGWAQRYFGSMGEGYANYDKHEENDGDNIEQFVANNDVIVVKIDGLNNYAVEELSLSPYNVSRVSTFRQFPTYFKELVQHIDQTYLTLDDRQYRAVSGLSMGGFMTFWLAAKFPHMIGAAGNFCGSTEFEAGPLEMPVRYAHADMYDNFKATHIRMHNGTRDRLRFYHQDMNRYLQNLLPHYEFQIYEASHVTCGLGDMFADIMEAFAHPLPLPDRWDYIDIYPNFEVWDYIVESSRTQSGYTILEEVDQHGFRLAVRNFLPDGELMPQVKVKIKTAPLYKKETLYHIKTIDLRSSEVTERTLLSDSEGRLTMVTRGSLMEVAIAEHPSKPQIQMSNITVKNADYAVTGKSVDISVELINKGWTMAKELRVEMSAMTPDVKIVNGNHVLPQIQASDREILAHPFTLISDRVDAEKIKLLFEITDQDGQVWTEEKELIVKEDVPQLTNFILADGLEKTVVQAAVDSVRKVWGSGNGDGQANPGERLVFLIEDQGKFYRADVYTAHTEVNPNGVRIRIADPWQEYDHIGGSAKYTEPLLSSFIEPGTEINFYVEYWVPGTISGQHIIKKGKVTIPVTGKDQTGPVLEWVQVRNEALIEARIYDGSSVDSVTLTLSPNETRSTMRYVNWEGIPDVEKVTLVDDGTSGDVVAGDGIYSRRIENSPSYFYNFSFDLVDQWGNKTITSYPEVFFLKDTRY